MPLLLTSPHPAARLARLFVGLVAYGVAIALMIRGNLGASPWDVFAQGMARTTGISFGWCTILISVGVLLLWIPLRQRLGFGTVANAVLIGLVADAALARLPQPEILGVQIAFFAAGLVLLAFATALYIGAGMGTGPRDGLMAGLVRVTGRPVWLIRAGIEITVVGCGFLLGGVVGAGTVVFAATVGPLTQLTLRWLRVDLHAKDPRAQDPRVQDGRAQDPRDGAQATVPSPAGPPSSAGVVPEPGGPGMQ